MEQGGTAQLFVQALAAPAEGIGGSSWLWHGSPYYSPFTQAAARRRQVDYTPASKIRQLGTGTTLAENQPMTTSRFRRLPLFALAFIALVAAIANCGESSTCDLDEDCDWSCSGCERSCHNSSDCQLDCEDGGCDLTCDNSANCNLDCPGGDCTAVCANSADCNLNCAEGGCTLSCEDDANCNMLCSGGGCTLNCGPQADCSCVGCN
jgi:hypothetical protein